MVDLLLFFDIDGTLLRMSGAGRAAFVRSLRAVFGWEDDIAYVNFSGATDLLVLEQIMARHGRSPRPADVAAFFAHLPLELERAAREFATREMPGAGALVRAMAADAGTALGVITGNIRACAAIKLRQIGLDSLLGKGGFGDDRHHRDDIAKLALDRLREASGAPPDCRCVLIGDTPSDIAAARAMDAEAWAVATGELTSDELSSAGADHILTSLQDTDTLCRRLRSHRHGEEIHNPALRQNPRRKSGFL